MRKVLILFLFAMLLCLPRTEAAVEKITLGHIVQKGDTLDSIAKKYIKPELANNPKAVAEFKEGIYELNYEDLRGRPRYQVKEGDFLRINIFAEIDYD